MNYGNDCDTHYRNIWIITKLDVSSKGNYHSCYKVFYIRKKSVFSFLIFVQAHSRSNRNIIYLTLDITSYKMEHFARIGKETIFEILFYKGQIFHISISSNRKNLAKWHQSIYSVVFPVLFFQKFSFLLKSHHFHIIFAFASVCNPLLIFPF